MTSVAEWEKETGDYGRGTWEPNLKLLHYHELLITTAKKV